MLHAITAKMIADWNRKYMVTRSLVDRSPKRVQGHGPKTSPNQGEDGYHGQEDNERAYLGRPPFVGVGISGNVPHRIER
jgi:hypothetical protein